MGRVGNSRDAFPFRYAVCDVSCTSAASWTITPVGGTTDSNIDASRELARTFALDREGRPRFVYVDFRDSIDHSGTFLAACDVGCTAPEAWEETRIDMVQIDDMALALDAQGRPRIVFAAGGGSGLGYAWCDADCGTPQGVWKSTLLETPAEAVTGMPAVPFCTNPVWSGGQMPRCFPFIMSTASCPRCYNHPGLAYTW